MSALEKETGIVLPDSPTHKVSEDDIAGKKEEHEFPTLSLAKTKKTEELVKWAEGRPIWLSWKLDGLTLVATYDDGKLTKVVTRGNGHQGTNITHLARAIAGSKKVLVLDEPITGLDPVAAAHLYYLLNRLNQNGTTIITISHDISKALSAANKLLIMSDRPHLASEAERKEVLDV